MIVIFKIHSAGIQWGKLHVHIRTPTQEYFNYHFFQINYPFSIEFGRSLFSAMKRTDIGFWNMFLYTTGRPELS